MEFLPSQKRKARAGAQRNYGIDALRLLSMFQVVVLHVLGQGGILAQTSGAAQAVACLLQVGAYCAVNCYGLISGFVCYSDVEKPHRYVKYAHLYLSVLTYSLGISLGLRLLMGPESVPVGLLLKCAFPVTTARYWYVTAYTALFFFIPYLNRLLRSLTEGEFTRLIVLLLVFFSLLEIRVDLFKMDGGYSVYWLSVLYCLGAWLKKCRVCERIRASWAVAALLAATLLTWLVSIRGGENRYLLMTYVSPTIVINALALFVLFLRLRLRAPARRFVACFSPAAFGVYICHEHSLVKGRFPQLFGWVAELEAWQIAPAVLGCAAAMFFACLLVEKLRLVLFDRLGIDRLIDALYACAARRCGRLRKKEPSRR